MFKRENTLFVEKYRPQSLETFVGSESIKETIQNQLNQNDIQNMLFFGPAGSGKTTLAKLIVANLDCASLVLNASDERGIETIRDKVTAFASAASFQPLKVVVLDEADFLTIQAQASLRNVIEKFSRSTRFILTCNYVEKIIDPIQSRCQTFSITPPSKKEVAIRLKDILDTETVTYERSDLAVLVNSGYPDIRRVLNAAQRQVVGGTMKIDKTSTIQANYMEDVKTELMSKDNVKTTFTKVRKIIADSKVKDFTPFYRFLYDEVDTYGGGKVGNTILTIAEAQYKDTSVVDKEINVMSMLLQILVDIKG